MNHKTCQAPGCSRACESRFGKFCPAHASRHRRHGHPEQQGVTKAMLKPYFKAVRRIRARNKKLDWSAVDARWDAVVETAKGIIADIKAGKAYHLGTRQAAASILTIAENVEVKDIIDHVIAVYLMQAFEPTFFRDDHAFNAQLVRILRKTTPANALFWTTEAGMEKRAYQELTPSARKILATWITTSLGPVGVHLVKLEEVRIDNGATAKAAFHDTLSQLRV